MEGEKDPLLPLLDAVLGSRDYKGVFDLPEIYDVITQEPTVCARAEFITLLGAAEGRFPKIARIYQITAYYRARQCASTVIRAAVNLRKWGALVCDNCY